MEKEKILLIAQNGLDKGGVQTVIMNIVRNLSKKYQFDIILFTKKKCYYNQEFQSYGGKIYNVVFLESNNVYVRRAEKLLRRIFGLYKIKKIIKTFGPYKAIHCHNSIESDIALKAAKQCGIRVRVNHIHVVFNDEALSLYQKHYYLGRKNKMNELATISIGCSEKACRSFFKNKYKVILNPFDDITYKNKFSDIKFENPVLVQVGNYSDLKNQLFTLAVFVELLKEYPDAHLNFVGHDVAGYMTQIKQFISEHRLSSQVHLYQFDSNIPSILDHSSYFLLPSRTESFGIVLVEAQAMGLKCFVSDQVPLESNAGGCRYLSIDANPKKWSDEIIKDFKETKGQHISYNVNPYKSSVISKQIEELYNI